MTYEIKLAMLTCSSSKTHYACVDVTIFRIASFRVDFRDGQIDQITTACETFENNDLPIAEKATMIASLNHERYFHALVVVNDKLLAIGG